MRRILSAAAALVLAFGVVLVGATTTYADDTSSFSLTTDPVYNNGPLDFVGHLDALDYVSGFTYSVDGGPNVDWGIAGDCTSGIQVGSSTPSDFSCTVPFPDEFSGGTNFVITANISEPSQPGSPIVPFTANFTVVPGSYTDNYSATPEITNVVVGPAALSFSEQLNGGADVPGIEVYPYGGGESSLCQTPQPDPASCTLTGLTPGLYEIDLTQSWTDVGGGPTTRDYVFNIPDAPTVAVDSTDPAYPYLYGSSGTVGNQIAVDGPSTCGIVPVQEGEGPYWSCELGPLAGGASYDYSAVEISQTSAGLHFDGERYSFLPGTESASSDTTTIDVPVYLPNSSYAFTTGGITIHSTPAGTADRVGIELYSVTPGDGYSYNLTEGCPALQEGEGGLDQDINEADTGASDCTFPTEGGALEPGIWDAFSYENYTLYGPYNHGTGVVFTVPNTPSVTAVSHNTSSTVTLSGTGTPGDHVFAVADGVPGTICNATAGGDGTWSCTTSATFGGAHTFRAYDQDASTVGISGYQSGGLSAVSEGNSLTLPAIGTEKPGSSTVTPPAWTFTLTGIDLTNIHPGDAFTVHASGLPAGAVITVVLHSTPITLGTTTVAGDGTMTGTYTIPADVPVGAHEIVLTMAGTGLTPTTSVQPVTIVPVVAPAAGGQIITTDPSKAADSSKTPTSHISHINPADPVAPNILTRSINSIQDVVAHPAKISAAVAIGLVLLIFATLPARLLNATIAENYENLVKRVPRLGRRPRWFENLRAGLARAPIVSGVVLSAVTAFLFGFADPNFGFTLASLRLILGLAIALFVVEYLANAVTGRIIHKAWSLTVQLNIRPLGLVLTVIGVVASRLLHFSPGFLIGLVLGLVLTGRKAEEDAWKAVLVRSGVVLGFGLVAWLGYSALTTGEGGTATFWNELFVEALVAITTEGIVAILVELLPFRLLEGERIWHRSRILWGVLYFLVIAAFVIAVVPWEGNWKELGSALWVWIAVVAGFALVCLAIYFYFRFWSPFHETEQEQEEDETVEVGAGG